jgi:hypothetical protein
MNSGTRRSDGEFARLGALVIAGLGPLAGGVFAAVLVRVAEGADSAGLVAVEDDGVVELMEVVGVRDVCDVAPAQPARSNARAVAPAREPAAYRRGSLTRTDSSESTNEMSRPSAQSPCEQSTQPRAARAARSSSVPTTRRTPPNVVYAKSTLT